MWFLVLQRLWISPLQNFLNFGRVYCVSKTIHLKFVLLLDYFSFYCLSTFWVQKFWKMKNTDTKKQIKNLNAQENNRKMLMQSPVTRVWIDPKWLRGWATNPDFSRLETKLKILGFKLFCVLIPFWYLFKNFAGMKFSQKE